MLGIVILNFMTYKETIKCIDSILKNSSDDIKIYVVENNSPNESYEVLVRRYKDCSQVQILKSPNNGGYAKGNNIGITESIKDGCEYSIITNNDVEFLNNSMNTMYEFIKANNNIVIVGPQILDEKYKIQNSVSISKVSLLEFIRLHESTTSKQIKQKILDNKINEPQKVYNVSGCCFIINNYLFKKIGAFDEETFLYNEENILGIQSETQNLFTYYLPSAKVIHKHGETTGKQSMFVNREFLVSSFYYWKKYRRSNKLTLVLLWIYFTFRWAIKSIYSKDLRSGWRDYFIRTISGLKNELRRKVEFS